MSPAPDLRFLEPDRQGFVLAVDKPVGPTSHDVVAWARRALGTRAIGHTGTLDPAASGVLVLTVGEATKLVPYLTLDDKEYDARLSLGVETDTLDAEGIEVERAPVPEITLASARAATERFVGRSAQRAPIYSAIKRDGVALHERARRGEEVEAPVRDVEAHAITVTQLQGATLEVHLHVGKGYYVRSFARDFARALGTVGHLTALRRTRSGVFSLERALDGALLDRARREDDAKATLRAMLPRLAVPMLDAIATMPRLTVDAALERDARHGKPVHAPSLDAIAEGEVCALVRDQTLIALARREGDVVRVVRGFVPAHDGEP